MSLGASAVVCAREEASARRFGTGGATPLEERHRPPLVDDVHLRLETEMLRQSEGDGVLRMDDADRPIVVDVVVAPGEGSFDRLPRKASPLKSGGQSPADFRRACEAGLGIALELVEADLSHESPGSAILDEPEAVTEKRPTSRIAQKAQPDILPGQGPSADKTGHDGIAPQLHALAKVFGPVTAQDQARGL